MTVRLNSNQEVQDQAPVGAMLKGRVWIFSFLFLLDSNMDKLTGAGARR
jgi:hypothetical protein